MGRPSLSYPNRIMSAHRILFAHSVSASIIALRSEIARGNAGVWSSYPLYREDIATFAAGGDCKQSDAAGFIENSE